MPINGERSNSKIQPSEYVADKLRMYEWRILNAHSIIIDWLGDRSVEVQFDIIL